MNEKKAYHVIWETTVIAADPKEAVWLARERQLDAYYKCVYIVKDDMNNQIAEVQSDKLV